MRSRCLLLAVLAAAAQTTNIESEIRALRQKSNQAFAARDIRAFADTLGEDYTSTRGNSTAVTSRQEQIDVFTKQFQDPASVTYVRTTDRVDVSSAGPVAAEHGHWQAILPGGKPGYGGTYLAYWRRYPAGWKLRSELFVILSCQDQAACAAYVKSGIR